MQSAKGETIPFPAPIRTRDARGCVEKWLIQVEEQMKNSVRDIIDGALETVSTSSRCEWVQEWPCQAVLVAAFLDATVQSQEAIKGKSSSVFLKVYLMVINDLITSDVEPQIAERNPSKRKSTSENFLKPCSGLDFFFFYWCFTLQFAVKDLKL